MRQGLHASTRALPPANPGIRIWVIPTSCVCTGFVLMLQYDLLFLIIAYARGDNTKS